MAKKSVPVPIFIDTSAFKALIDETDEFHQVILKIKARLQQQEVVFYTSNYIIDETATLIRAKKGLNHAVAFQHFLMKVDDLMINRVTTSDEADAWTWFEQPWSKLSFTDCVSFIQMKRLGIQRVLSFDHHFEQAGFMLERADG